MAGRRSIKRNRNQRFIVRITATGYLVYDKMDRVQCGPDFTNRNAAQSYADSLERGE